MSTSGSVLTAPPAVPDGVYRIRSVLRNPNVYLEWQADTNDVRPAELKPDSDAQKWKISLIPQTGTYFVTSVAAGGGNLSTSRYVESGSGQTWDRLVGGGSQMWSFEPRLDQFIIGAADNEKCVDLTRNNMNSPNQRFVLETADTTDTALRLSTLAAALKKKGNRTHIKNRGTGGYLCINLEDGARVSPVCLTKGVKQSTWDAISQYSWIVWEGADGFTFANLKSPGYSYRWLGDSDGPVVSCAENMCRLIPVADTEFYLIALSTASHARTLKDATNGVTDNTVALACAARMDRNDVSQHWQFQ